MKNRYLKKNIGFIFKPIIKKPVLSLILVVVFTTFIYRSYKNQQYYVEYRFINTTEQLSHSEKVFIGTIFMQRYDNINGNENYPFKINAYFLQDVLTIKIVGDNLKDIQSFSKNYNQEAMNMLKTITLQLYEDNYQAKRYYLDQYNIVMDINNKRMNLNSFMNLDQLSSNRFKSLVRMLENRTFRLNEAVENEVINTDVVKSWSTANIQTNVYKLNIIYVVVDFLIAITFLLIISILYNNYYSKKEDIT